VCVSRSNEGARSPASATLGRPGGGRGGRRQRVIVLLVAFCSQ
jgi:hypothetical protein